MICVTLYTFCGLGRGWRRGLHREPLYARADESQGELLVLHVGRVQRELHRHLHEEPQHDVAAGLDEVEMRSKGYLLN